MNKKKAEEIAQGYYALLHKHKKLIFEVFYSGSSDKLTTVSAFNRKTGKLVFMEQCLFTHELHRTLQLFLEDAVPKDNYVDSKCRNKDYEYLTEEPGTPVDNLFKPAQPPPYICECGWITTFFLTRAREVLERVRSLEDHGWQIVSIEQIKQGKYDTFDRKIIARIPEYPHKRGWVYKPTCSRRCCCGCRCSCCR